jgi:hypothetical protein
MFKHTETRHSTSWILCLAPLTSNIFLDYNITNIYKDLICCCRLKSAFLFFLFKVNHKTKSMPIGKELTVAEISMRSFVSLLNLQVFCIAVSVIASAHCQKMDKIMFKYTENRHPPFWILCLATLTSNAFLDH